MVKTGFCPRGPLDSPLKPRPAGGAKKGHPALGASLVLPHGMLYSPPESWPPKPFGLLAFLANGLNPMDIHGASIKYQNPWLVPEG